MSKLDFQNFVNCNESKLLMSTLLTMSLSLKPYYKDILKEVACDIHSRNYLLHVSENCPELGI